MSSTPSLKDLHSEIDNWFRESVQKPPIAHDVLCHNQAHRSVAELKERIAGLYGEKKAEPAPEAVAEDAAAEPQAEDAPKTKSKSKK